MQTVFIDFSRFVVALLFHFHEKSDAEFYNGLRSIVHKSHHDPNSICQCTRAFKIAVFGVLPSEQNQGMKKL